MLLHKLPSSLKYGTRWKSCAAHQGLGVAEHVVLEELVQHVEAAVRHQGLDHQLVQVVLREQLAVNDGKTFTGEREASLCSFLPAR